MAQTIHVNKLKCPKCDAGMYRIMAEHKGIRVSVLDSVIFDSKTEEMLTAHVIEKLLLPKKTLWYCNNCYHVCDTEQLTRHNLK